jgi:hypothetical protein
LSPGDGIAGISRWLAAAQHRQINARQSLSAAKRQRR